MLITTNSSINSDEVKAILKATALMAKSLHLVSLIFKLNLLLCQSTSLRDDIHSVHFKVDQTKRLFQSHQSSIENFVQDSLKALADSQAQFL